MLLLTAPENGSHHSRFLWTLVKVGCDLGLVIGPPTFVVRTICGVDHGWILCQDYQQNEAQLRDVDSLKVYFRTTSQEQNTTGNAFMNEHMFSAL